MASSGNNKENAPVALRAELAQVQKALHAATERAVAAEHLCKGLQERATLAESSVRMLRSQLYHLMHGEQGHSKIKPGRDRNASSMASLTPKAPEKLPGRRYLPPGGKLHGLPPSQAAAATAPAAPKFDRLVIRQDETAGPASDSRVTAGGDGELGAVEDAPAGAKPRGKPPMDLRNLESGWDSSAFPVIGIKSRSGLKARPKLAIDPVK